MIIRTDFASSSSEITSGGANRILPHTIKISHNQIDFRNYSITYMFTCVGLANTPRLFRSKQNCHAVRPRLLFSSSITIAFKSPRPLTSFTNGELMARTDERNCSPRTCARSAKFSSNNTLRAVIATAHPRGLLFYKYIKNCAQL